MLRLFSNVRKTLINEGKTSRYVRYAVGEFLLIVAGILVALQIQNWNEERKLERDRQELIENLKADFETNLESLQLSYEKTEVLCDGTSKFLLYAAGDHGSLTYEEVREVAHNAWGGPSYQPAIVAYQSAKSNGDITLIRNLHLQKLFVDFEQHLERFELLDNLAIQDFYGGGMLDLRKLAGSLSSVSSRYLRDYQAKQISMSESEYRELMARNDVYAIMENRLSLNHGRYMRLGQLIETTEQILTALEALD